MCGITGLARLDNTPVSPAVLQRMTDAIAHAVHMLGYYRDRFALNPDSLPGARDCDANTMAIPLHNRMSKEDYEYIAEILYAR